MTVVIKAQMRGKAGKGASRAIRREKLVPGVIYGARQDATLIKLDPRDVVRELNTGIFFNKVVALDIEGKVQKVLPRDVQFHVVNDSVEHVDFLRIQEGGIVRVYVPIEYVGLEDNVAYRMGGRLQIVRREVEFMMPADKIPPKLTVDVSKVKFGGIIRISHLEVTKGAKPTISDRDFVLASMKAPRGASDLEEETEAGGDEE